MSRLLQWWILLTTGLADLVSLISAEDGITLNPVRLQNGNIELQCVATGDQSGENVIRLGCDIRENKICRENCTVLCPIINDGTLREEDT
ncbi:unnamed protein product [Hymenolepis diminuta]|uniref:Uncharacterized protein n=1 Tax=Hymenolepis diminuta TaxID=6216 RepID=A0A564Z5E8_HYMDI|nr:unnamed protein product [Hymenolepis diminuta]